MSSPRPTSGQPAITLSGRFLVSEFHIGTGHGEAMKLRIRSVSAAASLALSVALFVPAIARAEPPGTSWILSRQSTAAVANAYADNQAGATGAGVVGGAAAAAIPFCSGPQAAGCALVVGAPVAKYAFDSGLLARAKRNNACVYIFDTREISVPAPAIPGNAARQMREYNGRHCPNVGDVPLTLELFTQLDE